MVIKEFTFTKIPNIIFGKGKLKFLPEQVKKFGSKILLVTGGKHFRSSEHWKMLVSRLESKLINYQHYSIPGEPSPEEIDEIVNENKKSNIDAIVAIGGGSVIDAGKAISAMLTQDAPVFDYLEGAGKKKKHDGNKVALIAVPTTAGTGSEATKNAVLSHIGPNGFKKSLRHDNFVPDIAIIDPELTLSCPPDITGTCGLDAFVQLLESYVSTNSTPLSDSLAYNGLECMKNNLILACTTGEKDVEIRSRISYASLLSGITLANAGLGIIHGLASPIGGFFNIPHGVVCGTLAASATKVNIEKLLNDFDNGNNALEKYSKIGSLLSGSVEKTVEQNCLDLVKILEEWVEILNIPTLDNYGIKTTDFDKIIENTSNKNNPVNLKNKEIKKILK